MPESWIAPRSNAFRFRRARGKTSEEERRKPVGSRRDPRLWTITACSRAGLRLHTPLADQTLQPLQTATCCSRPRQLERQSATGGGCQSRGSLRDPTLFVFGEREVGGVKRKGGNPLDRGAIHDPGPSQRAQEQAVRRGTITFRVTSLARQAAGSRCASLATQAPLAHRNMIPLVPDPDGRTQQ